MGDVKLTSEMLMEWADSSFMHYEGNAAPVLGFSHPRLVRAVLDRGQQRFQYLSAEEELSLQYPYGPIGQGSVERIYLEAFAAGNIGYRSSVSRRLPGGAVARQLLANAVCHPHLDSAQSMPPLEAFGRVYYPKLSDQRVTAETLGDIWDERGPERVLNCVWQLAENAAGIDAVLLLKHGEYRAILFLQLKAKALRGTDGKRLEGDSTLRTTDVVTKMHQHGAALVESLCRMADWDSADVIPWFVVVTTKRVANPTSMSTLLCGAKVRGGDEAVASAATDYLPPVVTPAAVRGVGCVLTREMLYDAWPTRIKRWAEQCRYAPWYFPVPDNTGGQTPAVATRKRQRPQGQGSDDPSSDAEVAAPPPKRTRGRKQRPRGRKNRTRGGATRGGRR